MPPVFGGQREESIVLRGEEGGLQAILSSRDKERRWVGEWVHCLLFLNAKTTGKRSGWRNLADMSHQISSRGKCPLLRCLTCKQHSSPHSASLVTHCPRLIKLNIMAGLKRKAAAPLPISEPDEPLFADSPDNQDSLEGDDSDGPGPDGADEDDDEGGLGFKAGVDDYDEDEDQLEDDEEEPESDDDPFQDSLNPDSRFQPPSLHTDSSGDDDSDESDYANEVAGPSTRKKNGGGKATLGGSRRMVTARKGNGRRTANRGKGKERVRDVEDDDEEMEEEDEEADENENEDDLAGGIGDGDEDDAGAEFE